MGVLFLAAAALVHSVGQGRQDGVAVDRVDLIEVNHFHDECGNRILDQVIFFDWCPANGRFVVRDWRLIKSAALWPQRDWQDESYRCRWHDGPVLREVTAPLYRETWTQHDPEVINRKYLPRSARRALLDTDLMRR